MACRDENIKQLRAYCQKHKLDCKKLKKKAELCDIVTKHRKAHKGECLIWKKPDLLKLCKSAGISCSSKATKDELCKIVSAHFEREAQRPESVLSRKDFEQKSCTEPRKGWLVKELEEFARAIGLSNFHGKRKQDLCTMISKYFKEVAPKPQETYQMLPKDLIQMISQQNLGLQDILHLCSDDIFFSKVLCNRSDFWKRYYNEQYKLMEKLETEYTDITFVQLVLLNLEDEFLSTYPKLNYDRSKTQINRVLIVGNLAHAEDFVFIPIYFEQEEQQRRSSDFRHRPRKDVYGMKFITFLTEKLPWIDVHIVNMPRDEKEQLSHFRRLNLILQHLNQV